MRTHFILTLFFTIIVVIIATADNIYPQHDNPNTIVNDWQTDADAFAKLYYGEDLSKEFALEREQRTMYRTDVEVVGAQVEWKGLVSKASLKGWEQLYGPREIKVLFGPEEEYLIHITGSRVEGNKLVDWKDMVKTIEPGTDVLVKMRISKPPLAMSSNVGRYFIMMEGEELELQLIE